MPATPGHGVAALSVSDRSPPSEHFEPTRGSLRLLADPVFGWFMAGRFVSTAGVWIHNIVAAILAYDLSGSAFVVGLVSVAQFAPQLVLAPLSGAMADRGSRVSQAVIGRLLVGLGSGALSIWVWRAAPDGLPGAWVVILAAVVVGLGFVLSGPAQEALIPALVRPGELTPAIALNTAPPLLARAAGPAVGAIVATAIGPAAAFAVAAAANFMFMFILLFLHVDSQTAHSTDSDRRIRAGLRYPLQDRGILLLLGGIAAIGIGADPVITLTPPLAQSLGAETRLVGGLASAYGVGAGVSFLVMTRLRRWLGLPWLATTGLLLLAGGLAAAGLVASPALAVGSFGVAGAGTGMALTSFTTQLQERLPDHLRGRIMALWAVAFIGTRPIAAAVNGAMADTVTLPAAFLLVAAIVVVSAWISRPEALSRRPAP